MRRSLYILFILSCFSILLAQPGENHQRPHAMERLENLKKIQMLETMKLEEKVGFKLIDKYNKHRDEMRELEGQRSDIIGRLESQLQDNTSDSEFEKEFTELSVIDKKIAESREKYISELKEILTTKQIAQYIVFERNFARHLRNIIRDVQRDRMRR